jgi:pimeloyl-ACP methyl ester carboxylesterase
MRREAMMVTARYAGALVVCGALLFGIGSTRHDGAVVRAQSKDTAIVPFKIAVPDAVLSDLKNRLARTRFPSEIEGSGWTYGTNLAYLRELVTYWQTKFDWRAQERALNQLPQFKTRIDDIDVHFVHQKSSHANATPLIFIHGWPGSFWEVTKVIGPLTEPTKHGGTAQDAFHVVALSLPGYGFSSQPRQPGYNNRRIAGIIAQLMARLGYTRYGAQGGDWGGIIIRQLGQVDPTHLIGLHSNLCIAGAPPAGAPTPPETPPSPEEQKRLAGRGRTANETGYQAIQGTKPQTLGYGLNDSPAGLAAWIVEKFRSWSDSDGNVEKRFTKDELLTNITIYWVTETGPSSIRLYYENRVDPGLQGRVEVPFACAQFPGEMFSGATRRAIEATYNVQQYTEMPRGGHFAAMEEPGLLVDDVRKFFRGRK